MSHEDAIAQLREWAEIWGFEPTDVSDAEDDDEQDRDVYDYFDYKLTTLLDALNAPPDPYSRYGTPEHEALLIEEERRGD